MSNHQHEYVGKRVRIYLNLEQPEDGVVIRHDDDGSHIVIGLLKQPVWLINPPERWHLI